jgi:hypothetical protein
VSENIRWSLIILCYLVNFNKLRILTAEKLLTAIEKSFSKKVVNKTDSEQVSWEKVWN